MNQTQTTIEMCNNCYARFWSFEPEPIHCIKCELLGLPMEWSVEVMNNV